MTLPNVAFFPQALLPLHIFEPRYRHMLRDVLATNRIFAVACLDSGAAAVARALRAPAPCGLHRPRARLPEERQRDVQPAPPGALPRRDRVDRRRRALPARSGSGALASEPGRGARREREAAPGARRAHQAQAQALAGRRGRDDRPPASTIEDPEIFADIAAFNLCDNVPVKQKLLETLDVNRRLVLLLQVLRTEIEAIVLHSRLQGGMSDEQIPRN